MRVRLEALATLALPLALAVLAGRPRLSAPATSDPTGPLVAVLAVLAWGCAAWLLLVLGLTWLSQRGVPVARRALRVMAPRSVRVLARLALGIGVATASLGGSAQAAPPSPAVDLDWGTPAPLTSAPALPPYQPEPVVVAPVATPVPVARVVVRPGDSLWAIAERQLGPRATTSQVAQSWPQWWLANRDQLGDDPDLIHPGAVLRVPPAAGAS